MPHGASLSFPQQGPQFIYSSQPGTPLLGIPPKIKHPINQPGPGSRSLVGTDQSQGCFRGLCPQQRKLRLLTSRVNKNPNSALKQIHSLVDSPDHWILMANNFAPHVALSNAKRHFWLSHQEATRVWAATGIQWVEARVLLNLLDTQGTHNKDTCGLNIRSAETERLSSRPRDRRQEKLLSSCICANSLIHTSLSIPVLTRQGQRAL